MLKFDSSHKSIDGKITDIQGTIKKCLAVGLTGIMLITCSGCGRTRDYNEYITEYYKSERAETSRTLEITENNKYASLETLPIAYPDVERIVIDKSPNVYSLDFIYDFEHLKSVTINECPYVTQELIDYLDENGIEHNLTQKDVEITDKVDAIIAEIISEDMSDEEKIQAICSYVISNFKYKLGDTKESNEEPLTWFLENGRGVCASYAYLTSVLLTKAGIENYEVKNNNHGWNMVQTDGKYYYIDTTNIKQIPIIGELLLKHFNVGIYYMSDPGGNFLSAMSDYDSSKVILPEGLVEAIERGEEEKTIIEKYQGSCPVAIITMLMALFTIRGGFALASNSGRRHKKRHSR